MALLSKSDIIIPVKKGDELKIEIRVSPSDIVRAPILKGEILGTAEFHCGDEFIGKTSLTAAEAVAARDFMFYIRLMFRAMQN